MYDQRLKEKLVARLRVFKLYTSFSSFIITVLSFFLSLSSFTNILDRQITKVPLFFSIPSHTHKDSLLLLFFFLLTHSHFPSLFIRFSHTIPLSHIHSHTSIHVIRSHHLHTLLSPPPHLLHILSITSISTSTHLITHLTSSHLITPHHTSSPPHGRHHLTPSPRRAR